MSYRALEIFATLPEKTILQLLKLQKGPKDPKDTEAFILMGHIKGSPFGYSAKQWAQFKTRFILNYLSSGWQHFPDTDLFFLFIYTLSASAQVDLDKILKQVPQKLRKKYAEEIASFWKLGSDHRILLKSTSTKPLRGDEVQSLWSEYLEARKSIKQKALQIWLDKILQLPAEDIYQQLQGQLATCHRCLVLSPSSSRRRTSFHRSI